MADKSKTIKNATDKELDELIFRLRKENEVQDLIGALKRKSLSGSIPYEFIEVSTEQPIEKLYHYGILGMHWGRTKSSDSSNVQVIRVRNSEDHDKRMALKTKKLSEMTNDELRAYTQRVMLEKQYKELSKTDISRGKKLVNDIINGVTKSARDAALNYVNKEAAKMVEELIKKSKKAIT